MQEANAGRQDQKARTRRDLLETAARLLRDGSRPTLEEVAEAAGVSRRTAYRYFRSQDHLLADAALENLRPEMARVVAAASKPADGEDRVLTLISALHPGNREYEPQLRAILAASLAEPAPDGPPAEPTRGHRRVDWIRNAAAPLEEQLSPQTYETLVSALTVITGYDAYRVLRDMRLLEHDEIGRVIDWMARTVLKAAKEQG